MPDDITNWRAARKNLQDLLARFDEMLARAEEAGEGLHVTLLPEEIVPLRIAIHNASEYYVTRMYSYWAEEELRPYRRAKLIMERDAEKDHKKRALAAIREAQLGRADKSQRNKMMATIYRSLVKPSEGATQAAYLDAEAINAGFPHCSRVYDSAATFLVSINDPETNHHLFEGVPYTPNDALRVVARLFSLGEHQAWGILNDQLAILRRDWLAFVEELMKEQRWNDYMKGGDESFPNDYKLPAKP